MSAELRPRDGLEGSADGEPSTSDSETVLAMLDDPDCRALLEATTDEALTAGELIERCGVPRSTTYRKLERLTEAGLLEERVRISPDGKHASEYRRTFDNVTVSLGESDGVTVGLTSTSAPSEAVE
jgi:DNA-binding transcriptional ArsR family regulator